MGQIISISLDVTKVRKERLYVGKNGAKYLKLTISVNDEEDQYGNNVSAYEEQSKEEREAKEKRNYLGNGKVTWNSSSGGTQKTTPQTAAPVASGGDGEEGLPF